MLKDFKISKLAPYLIFLVLSLPLERIPSWEFFGYTLKINQFAVIILFIVFFVYWLKKKVKIVNNIFIPLIFLFLGAGLLSFWHSAVLERSIIFFLLYVFVALLFIILPSIIEDEKILKLIAKYLFIITAVVCLFGLYQYLGDKFGLSTHFTGLRELYTKEILGFPRIQSTLIEPLYLANFLIIPGSLLLALFLSDQLKTKWLWLGLFFVIFLTVFALTVSRSGYLALVTAFLVIISLRFKEFFTWKKFLFLFSVLVFSALLVVILLGNAIYGFTAHNRQAVSTSNQEPSAVERRATDAMAIQAFKKYPLSGIGLGNFGPYYAHYPSTTPAGGWQTVNNEYLEILAESGIFGFLTFIIFLAVLLYRSWLAYKKVRNQYLSAFLLGSTAALVGILVQYYFFSTLYIIYIWFLMGLIVAIQEMVLTKIPNPK